MKTQNLKIIFIHGYTSSHLNDWYPAIAQELDRLGIDYTIPDLPGGEHPHVIEWIEVINRLVLSTAKPVVLIGHSLGTRAILLYLERYKPTNVKEVILLSCFSDDLKNGRRHEGKSYPDFFVNNINIEVIKSLVPRFIVVHSTDDKAEEPTSGIDYVQGVVMAQKLGAKLISPVGRGHLDMPENAQYVLEILREELHF